MEFGRSNLVLVAEPTAIRRVLVNDSRGYTIEPVFTKRYSRRPRPRNPQFYPRTQEEHLEVRRVLHPAFSPHASEATWGATLGITDRVFPSFGDKIDLLGEMQRVAECQCIEDIFASSSSYADEDLHVALHDWLGAMRHVTTPLINLLDMLNVRRLTRQSDALNGQLATLRQLIEDRRSLPPGDDTLSRLVNSDTPLTDDDRVIIARIVFLATCDAWPTALAWAIYHLARHRQWIDAVREEAETALARGVEAPSPRDLSNTYACLSETLRLYPPGWRIGRINHADTELAGQRIPALSYVWASPFVIQRDPEYWPAPEAFLPERWLKDNEAAKLAYLPWGLGVRQCLGRDQAIHAMLAALCAFVHRFDFRLADDAVRHPGVRGFAIYPDRPVVLHISSRS